MNVAISKHGGKLGEGYSARERSLVGADPGRPWNRPAGGWVADLVGLQKVVMLCDFCAGKFNPRANHYEPWRRGLYAIAKCDGCNQYGQKAKLFIHQSTHDEVGEFTPARAKRGRWGKR